MNARMLERLARLEASTSSPAARVARLEALSSETRRGMIVELMERLGDDGVRVALLRAGAEGARIAQKL